MSPIRLTLLTTLLAALPAVAQEIDFPHEVVPVLRDHCAKCHLEDNRKGGLSMNTRELLLEGSENGPSVTPGRPEESRLLEVIMSTDPDEMMPPKGDRLSAEEVDAVRLWIAAGVPWEPGFTFGESVYEPPLHPLPVELPPATDGRDHPIDRIVDRYFAEHDVPRPAPLGDAAFVRRVSMDLIGLLPDPETLAAFAADDDPDKRAAFVAETLDRTVDYTEHWLTFWNDLLRNDYEGTGYIDGGRKQVTGWLYNALLTNMPYDDFARELLAPPTPESAGFINGIQWRGSVNASQGREIQFAQSISQTFLGLNMKCASCHDSFTDRWKLDEAYGLAAIFSERPLEINRCDIPTGRMAKAGWIFPELGEVDSSAPKPERLRQVAALMTHQENGRFARTIVNRLWHRLMGRGIVHPVDAMDTPPWSADLLNHLANRLVEDGYDIKKALAFIAGSQAYQSQAVAASQAGGDEFVFRGPVPKRLTAEQFVDAVWTVTGTAPAAPNAGIPRDGGAAPAGKWIWSYADGSKSSPPGETILLRRTLRLPADPQSVRAVITCDNECRVEVNGQSAFKSDNWQRIVAVDLAGFRAGDNVITVTARNAGTSPGAAGFYFEAKIVLPDSDPLRVVSDGDWQWAPADTEGNWQPAVPVAAQDTWKSAAGALTSAVGDLDGSARMVRASLVPADLLQRALGRPNREQIVSMRPDTLTTLESIDLANGEDFATLLHQGAEKYRAEAERSFSDLIENLYLRILSRPPSAEEKSALMAAAGPSEVSLSAAEASPKQAVEDLLWTLFLLPEFQFVR